MFINQVEIKNDIGPIGLWHLSPGAPVSPAISCTVWSKTEMSSCPCECRSCLNSPPPLGYGAYERAALCLESAFQDPSFGTGSAVVPTSAPVKHRFFKMVRRPTLLHIPVILPPVFLNMSSKFERLSPNCALTKITWRLCVPSGISELPCAFAANSGGQIFLEEGSSGRVQSGFSSALFKWAPFFSETEFEDRSTASVPALDPKKAPVQERV